MSTRARYVWAAALVVFLTGLILVPLAQVPIEGSQSEGFFAPWFRLLSAGSFYDAWRRTAVVAFGAVLIAVPGAFMLGWLVLRTNVPGARILSYLMIIPFLSPLIVNAFGWAAMGAPFSGWVNTSLRALDIGITINVHTLPGIALVLGLSLLPVAYVVVRPQLLSVGRDEEEAAIVAGASRWRTLRSVTLPLLTPSLAAGGVLVLSIAAANFSVPGILGFPVRLDVVPTRIFLSVNNAPTNYANAAVYAISLVLVLLIILFVQQRFELRARLTSSTVSSRRPAVVDLGPWKWFGLVIVVAYLMLGSLLPVGSVVLASLLPYWGAPLSTLSFDNYGLVLGSPVFQSALKNTFVLALAGATVTTAAGGAFAYLLSNVRLPGSKAMSVLSSLPLGLPGIVVGLGYLFTYSGTPLYGTLWIVVLALTARFLPLSMRNISAAGLGIHGSMHEAARTVGAPEWRVFLSIAFPMLRAAFIGAWALLFLVFAREVDTNILLSGSAPVLATQLYEMWTYGDIARAAVTSVVLMSIAGVTIGVVLALSMRGRGRVLEVLR